MKRFIKSAGALLIALTMTIPAFAAPSADIDTDNNAYDTVQPPRFSDIYEENYTWARIYINSMAQRGLISGYEDGTFRPDNDVTRLEALSLFARAMGSNDSVNKEVLKFAHETYDSVIGGYDLKWGGDEIAYLMYKGVLKRADLDTYLRGDEKDSPMMRYEAAIIITKAMGKEDKALSDLGVVLDYSDAREVPSNAIQYVAYATEAGVMEGMGDGMFSPNTEVKRSQMAVMLSRTVDKTDYIFKKMNISSIDTSAREITVTTSSGNTERYAYTDETVMKNCGYDVQPSRLGLGVDAVFTFSGNKLAYVDTVEAVPDETVKGKYVGYTSKSGRSIITITPDNYDENQSYECDDSISVTYDNTPATVRSFTRGDIVTLELANGRIVRMTGETKSDTISNAIVESVDLGSEVTMTISHGSSEYNGKTYSIDNNVSVKKNDSEVGLNNIYKGDKVKLTLEYGVITKIVAESSKRVYEGTIKALTISTQSEMTVIVNKKETTYQIPKDVEILINGEEGTLYDFRVGDNVKITLDSDAITKIVATSTQESAGAISGVVTGVNASYGVISVMSEGSATVSSALCKDDWTTFITADGKTKKMKDIKVGQTVEIKGTNSSGAFLGKLVVIISE